MVATTQPPADRTKTAPEAPALLAHHFEELHTGSGLSVDVIAERGYRSAWGPHDVQGYSFPPSQLRGFPALVLPVWGPDGSNGAAVLKPDTPRVVDGKPLKYEWAAGTRLRLDVPPRCRPLLADPGVTVVFTEGIKKGDAGAQHGLCVVALNGVWAFKDRWGVLPDFEAIPLQGRHAVIAYDSDVMGNPKVQQALHAFRDFLTGQGAVVSLAYLPPGPEGAKVGLDDYLLTHPAADFRALIGKPPAGGTAPDEVSSLTSFFVPSSWPRPPAPVAYAGLAGDVVRLAHGCTEADPVAILGTFWAKLSAAVGRGPYTVIGPETRRMVEFMLLIGQTAKARKGTSEAAVDLVFRGLDEDLWHKGLTAGGLSTGEGVVHDLRDGRDGDPGPEDRRRLYVETEFVRILKAGERSGNNLSSVLRQLWDGVTLGTLTKGDPERASQGHGAILGHSTAKELRDEAGDVSLHNGLLNRFQTPVVRGSAVLSAPGVPKKEAVERVTAALNTRLRAICEAGPLLLEPTAGTGKVWRRLYREMRKELPGAVGAALARLETHCLLMARFYALADPRNPILGAPGQEEAPAHLWVYPRHLQAAAAWCRYLRRSAFYLYGDKTGDAKLDAILDFVRDGPKSKTAIQYEVFKHNSAKAVVDEKLALGISYGRLRETKGKPKEAGGRPPILYEGTKYERNEETPSQAWADLEAIEAERSDGAEREGVDYINRLMWGPAQEGADLWATAPTDADADDDQAGEGEGN